MPRHKALDRESSEPAPGGKVIMRRDANGNLVPVFAPKQTTETTEAKPKPREAEDPRTLPFRNIPPIGGA